MFTNNLFQAICAHLQEKYHHLTLATGKPVKSNKIHLTKLELDQHKMKAKVIWVVLLWAVLAKLGACPGSANWIYFLTTDLDDASLYTEIVYWLKAECQMFKIWCTIYLFFENLSFGTKFLGFLLTHLIMIQ